MRPGKLRFRLAFLYLFLNFQHLWVEASVNIQVGFFTHNTVDLSSSGLYPLALQLSLFMSSLL